MPSNSRWRKSLYHGVLCIVLETHPCGHLWKLGCKSGVLDQWYSRNQSQPTLEKENRPPCCRWRKIYRNHCLIEDICGWNIIQTRIVVCTANPVTEICDGQTYARYCLCLHLFPATEFCLKPWLR